VPTQSFAQTNNDAYSSLFELLKYLFSSGNVTVITNSDSILDFDKATIILSSSTTNTGSEENSLVSINNVSLVEGNSGTKNFEFTVTRSGNVAATSSVNFATSDGTATLSNSDYASNSGTLNFAASQTSNTVTILVNGDTTIESNETFNVNLSSCVSCIITDNQGIGTITNDDSSQPNITINDISLTEGNSGTKNFEFTVTRSNNVGDISVNYSTSDNTANSPSDYTSTPLSTLNFTNGGPLTQNINVIVKGDTAVEPNETFNVNLSSCVGCNISDNQGIGTIIDDDSLLPNITINDVTLSEGNSGTKNFAFTVSRSNNTGAISVSYSTASNTATAPTDYTSLPLATLNFANGGPSTQSITVSINGDKTVEFNETFFVNLTNCVGCNIADNQGLGTITNDDSNGGDSDDDRDDSDDDSNGKETICHIPPGNPNKAHTIKVGSAAVSAHLAHGDSLGRCDNESDDDDDDEDDDDNKGKGNDDDEDDDNDKSNKHDDSDDESDDDRDEDNKDKGNKHDSEGSDDNKNKEKKKENNGQNKTKGNDKDDDDDDDD
jgi:disulfide oxidoreductase YuzD